MPGQLAVKYSQAQHDWNWAWLFPANHPCVDPRTGKLTSKETPQNVVPRASCETDRVHLAQIDDWEQFRQMLDEANRANASFYPVDPRGLAVFDTPIMRQDVPGAAPAMVPPAVDAAMLRGRLTSLRTLAEATDGLAIVDSNDLAGGFRRVVADLSSYYLLGYYSTGKLDGRFHAITVKVKIPSDSAAGIRTGARTRRSRVVVTPRTGASLDLPVRVYPLWLNQRPLASSRKTSTQRPFSSTSSR